MVRKSQVGGNTTLRNEWYIGPEQPQVEKQLHNRYAQLRRINTAVRNGFTEFFQLKPEDIQDLVSYMDAQHWRR